MNLQCQVFPLESESKYTLANEIEIRRKQQRPFTNQEISTIAYSLLRIYASMGDIGFLHLNINPSNIEILDVSNDFSSSVHGWINRNGIIMDKSSKIYAVRWIAETEKLRTDAKQCVDNMMKFHYQEGSTLVRMKKEEKDGLFDNEAIAICLYQAQLLDLAAVQVDEVQRYASKNKLQPIADLITYLLQTDTYLYRTFEFFRWFAHILPKHVTDETREIQRGKRQGDDRDYENKLFELARREKKLHNI